MFRSIQIFRSVQVAATSPSHPSYYDSLILQDEIYTNIMERFKCERSNSFRLLEGVPSWSSVKVIGNLWMLGKLISQSTATSDSSSSSSGHDRGNNYSQNMDGFAQNRIFRASSCRNVEIANYRILTDLWKKLSKWLICNQCYGNSVILWKWKKIELREYMVSSKSKYESSIFEWTYNFIAYTLNPIIRAMQTQTKIFTLEG